MRPHAIAGQVPVQPWVHATVRRLVSSGLRGAPLMWRIAEAVVGTPDRAVVQVSAGTALELGTQDYVSRLVYQGLYERAEAEVVFRLVQAGDTVVDAGANVGYFTALFSSAVGPSGRVLAFEPQQDLFERLTAAAHRFPSRVDVLDCALGAAEGEGTLFLGTQEQLGLSTLRGDVGGEQITTRIRPLGAVLAEQGVVTVDLLKVDVEGFEAEVLAGARDLLVAGDVRALIVEVSPGFSSLAWTSDLMKDLGDTYRCFEIVTESTALRVRCRLRELQAAELPSLAAQTNVLVVQGEATWRLRQLIA